MNSRARHIDDGERSGVLVPSNLARFRAEWIEPTPEVREVVETYWSVEWQLAPGEAVTQRIIDFPALTLSVEEGDVPAPFVLTAVRPGAWSRVIQGSGRVFAVRLRPAGLAVVADVDVLSIDHENAVNPQFDQRAHLLLQEISLGQSVAERASYADDSILRLLQERPMSRAQRIANMAVDALTRSPVVRSGTAVANELGISERTLQRALRATVGLGPNDVARRIRLQEVVRRLSAADSDAAATAADLGYVDQAHLINEFRSVAGVTPGAYVRQLSEAASRLVK